MKDISVCGENCIDCKYYEMCGGCNACNGVVFYSEGKECVIHKCCRTDGHTNCAQCGKLPCNIYLDNKDQNMTDEEFAQSVQDRINNLKG